MAGLGILRMHLQNDPLVDARAYYDAGARLNAGLALYEAGPETDATGLYLYPPLLAILFRPLALLPFEAAAAIWEVVVIGAFLLAIRRVGLREPVVLVLGALGLPILWALSIGQAEPLVTLALASGTPAGIAFAGHLKLMPWLAATWWLGRREWRSLAVFVGWVAGLAILQLVLEPAGTLVWLRTDWLRPAFEVRNLSPYAIHPLLWAGMVVALAVAAILLARTRAGWPLAVVLAVLAYPRLLAYQLMTLLAAFGGPRREDPQAR